MLQLYLSHLFNVRTYCNLFHHKSIFQGIHEIFEDKTSRHILARHVGVDALSCFIVARIGWRHRGIMIQIYKAFVLGDSKAMSAATAESRCFAYDPGAYFATLFFLSFQIKNLYDTLVWHDGPEYVFHHILAIGAAWYGLHPGFAIPYASFFFGISEISTAVVCLLANFDDDHGVIGLGDAFPMIKITIGLSFVAFFIVIRCIIWPIVSFYFVRDATSALKSKSPHLEGRRFVAYIQIVALVGLSALQIMWLGVIYFLAIEELTKVGFI